MSATDDMATRRRPVRGLPAPPATPGAAPVSEPSSSVHAAETPRDVVEPSPAPSPSDDSPETDDGQGGPATARTVPSRTAQRDPHSFRLYRELSIEVTRLVRELEDRGLDSDRLLHALLYSHLPASADAAEKLVRRWRRLQGRGLRLPPRAAL
jgi:hypothetical protein